MQLLGYGGKKLQAGSVIYDKIVNDRLSQLPPDTEDVTRSYLAQIAVIEDQMNKAPARLAASMIDDIKTNHAELQMLRAERKKISKEIASHLDIPYVGTNNSNVGIRV